MERSVGRRWRRLSIRAVVVLACAVTAGALAHTAQASTLQGVTFLGNPVPGDVITVVCGPTSFTYHVEGFATAPHQGRFTEDGIVVFDPLLSTIVSLDATFTVTSMLGGNVTGEKHWIGPGPLPQDTANCSEIGSTLAEVISTQNMCYRAEFADGSPAETGRSGINLTGLGELLFFTESFQSDPTITSCGAACPDEEDEDNDGLTDSREGLFSTLLGNADSDLDGIADGNDDANGNGEDDEDEDDDEDDGCPDPDSDGDGEDDEDEDDEDEDEDD
jgi:hypothetical protein